MSLRVWLPLNGDLHNQGISDLIFSAASSNTTTNANGKIGTCYTNNSHSAGGLISDKPILLGSQYSMCCWFKFTDLEASSNLGGGLISQHRYSKNTGFGLTIKYVSSTTGYLSVNTGTGSARTFNTYCGTTLLQANTWYHACGTYDGTNIKIYVNGILEKTQAYSMNAPEDYLTIFCWSLSGSSGAAIHGDYKLNGALNDVRIYDHCLSAAEVKEIAQGLVLHYKLNDGYIESTTNLSNPNSMGGWNNSGTCVRNQNDTTLPKSPSGSKIYSVTSTSAGSMAVTMGTTIFNVPSKTLTCSIYCYLSGTQDSSTVYIRSTKTDGSIGSLEYNGSSNPTTWPKNQWIRLTKTLTTNNEATTIYFCTYINPTDCTRAFSGWQIEARNYTTPYTNSEYLSNNLNISTNNLITGLTAGGQTTISNDNTVTTSGTNADTYFRLTLSTPMIKNHLYKLSCNVSGLANDGYWSFPIAGQSNTTIPTFVLKNGYNEVIFRANDACVSAGTSVMMDDNGSTSRTVVMTANNFKLYDVTPIIYDSSGFSNNGTIVGEFDMNTTSPRYDKSLYLHSIDPTTNSEKGISYIQTPLSLTTPLQLSFTWWAKPESGYGSSSSHAAFCTSTQTISPTDYNTTAFHHRDSGFDIYPSDGSGVKRLSFTYTKNEWHHYAVTYDGTTARAYQDGVLKTSIEVGTNKTLASFSQLYIGFSKAGSVWRKTLGSYSDFRVYVTQLLDTDIKQLYNVGMKIDNLGSTHTFEFIEQQSSIIFPIELSRSNLEFTNGLNRYTQSNCQVTLTDQGYHIYRPPNLTTANDGNTMWGGLKLVNQKTDTIAAYDSNRDNNWGLQKGHTYFAAFHAKGKSSNSTSWGWANNMGWSGGGVNASPTIITNIGIPSDFQGEKDCIFIFTINDDIAKNCTSAYSSYVANTTYLSYRHLTFGWGYSSTGTLGTDLYLTDLRLYDITNYMAKITKQGQAKFYDFVEQLNKAQIRRKSEFLSSNFIER